MALLAKTVAAEDKFLVKTMVLEGEDPPNLIYMEKKKKKGCFFTITLCNV